MGIGQELLALTERVDRAVELPAVRSVYVPEPHITEDKDAEFGIVELEDGAAGLFYAWLGESQAGISSRYAPGSFSGRPVIELARYFSENDDMARSVGLAAINAITQSLFARAEFAPTQAVDSMAGLRFEPGDHLGMVGNFPSLVRRAQSLGIPVTVIERKRHMLQEADGLSITLDPGRLSACNKVICTAATLINDSVDEMLGYCRHADVVAMIGPSASFIPEPLFARGVALVGGTAIDDAGAAMLAQRGGRGLRGCSRRYVIERGTWPGMTQLLADCQSE